MADTESGIGSGFSLFSPIVLQTVERQHQDFGGRERENGITLSNTEMCLAHANEIHVCHWNY